MMGNAIQKHMISAGLLFLLAGCGSVPKYPGPLTPEESLKTFQFADDFEAEIFAAEPWVIDPVSMEFDEEGNAYVVAMPDAYKPDSVKGKGQILLLKDLNGDGRADTSIVFADGLREATSVLPWKGGLLVTAAPNIIYLTDTSGDFKADTKEVVFSGFFNKNEEAQITNLRFGVDNWIYANNNGQAGEVSFLRIPGSKKLVMKGGDLRFRLDRNEFEVTSGRGQFGLAIDDWGHRFYTQNQDHISQVLIQKKYIDRNKYLPANLRSATKTISDHDPLMFQLTDAPYWRAERTRQRNKKFRENNMPETEHEKGYFTGGSGGTIYTGDLFPGSYYGSIFTGDVAGNLVHRDVLSNIDSPYVKAQRGVKEKSGEFMATTDSWVRPASFTVGPDGALYMMDMYRQHIETPLSIPEDLQVGMDFDAGNSYGRIYRIVPKNATPFKVEKPELRKKSSVELLSLLTSPNQWWRLQAQRLLLERQDKTVIPAARTMFETHLDARARLHALYVLEGQNALTANDVIRAMNDAQAGVRVNGALLAERFPACLPMLTKLAVDTSVQVAFQATLSLGEFEGPEVVTAMASILSKYGASSWFRTAVLSSNAGSSIALQKKLKDDPSFSETGSGWKKEFVATLTAIIDARNKELNK